MRGVLHAAIHACGVPGGTTQVTGASGPPLGGIDWVALFVAGGILMVLATGVAVAIVVANRLAARPVAVSVPAGAAISPDGYYWWDGAAWRPRF